MKICNLPPLGIEPGTSRLKDERAEPVSAKRGAPCQVFNTNELILRDIYSPLPPPRHPPDTRTRPRLHNLQLQHYTLTTLHRSSNTLDEGSAWALRNLRDHNALPPNFVTDRNVHITKVYKRQMKFTICPRREWNPGPLG